MPVSKADIIAKLRLDILSLQGFKPAKDLCMDAGLGPIKYAFPNQVFPIGAIHEFINTKREDMAASGGFIAGILSALMQSGAVCIWVSAARTIFPPALYSYGILPENIIFIDLKTQKHIPWVVEEALKCKGLAAVIGELRELDFTTSRRLQLAVEQSRVTGFIIRNDPRILNTTASVARWKITSLPSELYSEMPGVGHPRWNVELLKIRNGTPGKWQVEWNRGKFRQISRLSLLPQLERKKTG